jgi:hypothetical protein
MDGLFGTDHFFHPKLASLLWSDSFATRMAQQRLDSSRRRLEVPTGTPLLYSDDASEKSDVSEESAHSECSEQLSEESKCNEDSQNESDAPSQTFVSSWPVLEAIYGLPEETLCLESGEAYAWHSESDTDVLRRGSLPCSSPLAPSSPCVSPLRASQNINRRHHAHAVANKIDKTSSPLGRRSSSALRRPVKIDRQVFVPRQVQCHCDGSPMLGDEASLALSRALPPSPKRPSAARPFRKSARNASRGSRRALWPEQPPPEKRDALRQSFNGVKWCGELLPDVAVPSG